jgi:hypothetical protein
MKFLTPSLAVIAVIAIAVNVLQYERYSTRKPVVTVGNQAISRYEFEAGLEKQSGAPLLRKLVFEDLVRQAATKEGLMPTEADVDDRIQYLKDHPSLAQPQLVQQLSTPAGRNDLKTDMALENLRIQNATASDAEIVAFYKNPKNAPLFNLPAQTQTTMVVSMRQADADKAEHLLSENVQPETIASQPGLKVAGVGGFNINMDALIPADKQMVGKTVLVMKKGDIKSLLVHPISGGQAFLTFKAQGGHGNELQPLSDPKVKDFAARQVKLLKGLSPQQELATLYQSNTPVFNIAKYSSFFNDIQQFSAQNAKKTASAQ